MKVFVVMSDCQKANVKNIDVEKIVLSRQKKLTLLIKDFINLENTIEYLTRIMIGGYG